MIDKLMKFDLIQCGSEKCSLFGENYSYGVKLSLIPTPSFLSSFISIHDNENFRFCGEYLCVCATDYVYFETSSTSPYQIRRIEELNKTPSGNVEAKVMCFYRRRDLPTPLVQLADKHQSEYRK